MEIIKPVTIYPKDLDGLEPIRYAVVRIQGTIDSSIFYIYKKDGVYYTRERSIVDSYAGAPMRNWVKSHITKYESKEEMLNFFKETNYAYWAPYWIFPADVFENIVKWCEKKYGIRDDGKYVRLVGLFNRGDGYITILSWEDFQRSECPLKPENGGDKIEEW